MVGGATTVTEAVLLAAPVPLSFAVIAPVVLACKPAVVPVTFTENVHVVLAFRLTPDKLMLAPAAVTVPPQVVTNPFGKLTCKPAGNVSVKPMPVNPCVFALFTVNVRVVLPFSGIVAAVNVL